MIEQELADTNESLSDQTCTNQAICGAKMKCEQEMGAMSHDLDEMVAEAAMSEEKACLRKSSFLMVMCTLIGTTCYG